MKRLILMPFVLWMAIIGLGQPPVTMRIDNLKDAWGEPVIYVGQVKNGKPNGLGTFVYRNAYALRYVGYFVDGKPAGKGALVFNGGNFLWGEWKNGKLNGKGANLNASGDLYVGNFVDGEKSGYGNLFFKNNGFLQGSFAKDGMEGRVIYIGSEGKILNDNIYKNDKKNGYGYQYELKDKKLYKGTWSDGQWVSSGTPDYRSFLEDTRFRGEIGEKQILMGCAASNGRLQDTAFFRDLVNRKRYFGVYEDGRLRNGFIIRDDSTIFLGTLNEKGSVGPGSFLKRGKYYDEGTYLDDYLNGSQNVSINLEKNTVYYGSAVNQAEFTGKAWFSNKNGVLYNGEYLKGKFTGTGWRLDTLGFCTGGTWKEGTLTSFSYATMPNGKPVNTSPANLSESIAQLMELYQDGFEPIEGAPIDDWSLGDLDNVYNSYYRMAPGAKENFLGEYDGDYVQLSILYKGTDAKAATAKYTALCNQLAALSITYKGAPMKLTTTGKMMPADVNKSITTFSLTPDKPLKWLDFNVVVAQVKNPDTDEYVVVLGAGYTLTFEDWMDSFDD